VTVASLLSHLVVRSRLFYKINEKKIEKKINNDLAVVASQIPGGAIHDKWQMVVQCSEKLTEQFVGPYRIKAIISSNIVELKLLSSP